MSEMAWHPIACIFPMLADDDLRQLADDIKEHGQREPILLFEGKVLDGRNRWLACKIAEIEPACEVFTGTEQQAFDFVKSTNLTRRHLDQTQKGMVGARIKEYYSKLAKDRQSKLNGKSKLVANFPQAESGKARDQAGEEVGCSGKQIDKAEKVLKSGRSDLIEMCDAGLMSLHQASTELRREEKRKELEAKAEQAKAEAYRDGQPPWLLVHADVVNGLESVADNHDLARLIFADPPYNIGVEYGDHHNDSMPTPEFVQWCRWWITSAIDCLSGDGSFWLMINDEYAAELVCILKEKGLHMRAWIKWYETFGVNCSNNFNRTSRHILYFVADESNFVFNETAVLRPSDRQTKYGDKRAQSSGKILDDVWQIPRLIGTSKERIPDFPTQLPIELVQRIVEVASEPGDLVLDPFNGSGTTGVASIRTGRKYIGIDASEKFIDLADKRLRGEA